MLQRSAADQGTIWGLADVAQLVEHRHGKAGVKGSSPFVGLGFRLCRAKFGAPRLADQWTIEPAEIDLDRWQVQPQILTQAAKRPLSSSLRSARPRRRTLPTAYDPWEARVSGSSPDVGFAISAFQSGFLASLGV